MEPIPTALRDRLAEYDAALERDPDDAATLLLRAELFEELEREGDAQADYDRLAEIGKIDHIAVFGEGRPQQYIGTAKEIRRRSAFHRDAPYRPSRREESLMVAHGKDRHEACVASYEHLGFFGGYDHYLDWEVHCAAAQSYLELERYEAAEAAFRRALDRNPEHRPSLRGLARTMREAGRLGEALTLARRAAELHAAMPWCHAELAEALHALGRYDEALVERRRATKLKPSSPALRNRLAGELLHLGRAEEARSILLSSLELAPERASTHDELGWALIQLGDLEGAVRALERAIELSHPAPFPGAQLHRARALHQLGRHHEALAALDAVLASEPQNDRAHWLRGEALEASGNPVTALSAYERALELAPSPERRAALRRIRARLAH